MRSYVWLVVVLFFTHATFAQESTTNETNPPSLKWFQINTTHFRVLFPKGFDDQAQRMANTLETIHAPEAKTLGTLPRKISVVLQNQSSVSNAFVSITPRRSEFYVMPSQNYNFVGNNDWLNLLASHEYRHIVQFQHAKRGFNKLFYYLFGNNVLAGMSYVSAPPWFWEGDAVATETAFTKSGRGRIPNFDLVFRTNLMEGRAFNYNKQLLRSYKNNIPNHYVLGYNMVSYLRQRTGDPEIWSKVTARSWSVPFIPFRFSSALKKEIGLYVKDLYKEMAVDLQKKYQQQLDTLSLTSFEKVNSRKSKAYTDYLYPQQLSDGSIIAVKSGIGDIEKLVRLSPTGEEKVFTQGFVNETGMLSASRSRVVWNEYRYDPRWRVRNYSVVVAYDSETKLLRQLTHRSRYAGAAISPDGYKVATVETTTGYDNRLVVLDFFSGKVLKEFENSSNDFISMPRWSPENKSIVALKKNKSGKSIVMFDFETGKELVVASFHDENVGSPVPAGKYILYNSPVSGIDNIFAVDIETGKRFQVTTSKYGAYNAMVTADGKSIYYNNQGRDGMDVVKIPFAPEAWKTFSKPATPFAFATMLAEQEGNSNLLNEPSQNNYPIKRYSRLKGIVNPYSWGAYIDNSLAQADIGISSRDILSTTSVDAGYRYDINERTGAWRAGVSYQGLYPAFDFEVTNGNREVTSTVFSREVKFKWEETGVLGGIRLPLLLTRSKYYTELEISNSIGLTKTNSFTNELRKSDGTLISTGSERYVYANDTLIYNFTDRVNNNQLVYNQFVMQYTHLLKVSRRDFNPQWGQSFAFENYTTPYGGDYQGSLSAIRGVTYFPGLLKHHSIYFRGGYQKAFESSDLDAYTFRNRIFKPRGFSYPRQSEFASVSVNYSFPVWYPDVNLGPILNIQRVKANLFYDYGRGLGKTYYYRPLPNNKAQLYYSDSSSNFSSMGVEMTFDINFMRFLPQFEIGFRSTYKQANKYNNSGTVFEFLIGNIPF